MFILSTIQRILISVVQYVPKIGQIYLVFIVALGN